MKSVINGLGTDWSHCLNFETIGLEISQFVS